MSADRIRVTVDGEPVTREVNWDDVRAYLRAKGWTSSGPLWQSPPGTTVWSFALGERSRRTIDNIVHALADHEQRHPSAVLRDIARGTEPVSVEPLTDESLAYTERVLANPDDEIADADPALLRRLVATVRAREAAVRDAIRAEREACALIADEYTPGGNHLRRRREDADRIAERR